MEKDRVYVSDIHAGIDHELRWDGGRQILWVTPEGGPRIKKQGVCLSGGFHSGGESISRLESPVQ